jgi:hypothetical protein
VIPAFLVATAVAIPAGYVMHWVPILILPAVVYGGLVAEVALRVGQRRRSLAMQVVTGLAALIGGLTGGGGLKILIALASGMGGLTPSTALGALFAGFGLASTLIGVFVAVSRVRYL